MNLHWDQLTGVLLRWSHVLCGITWLGLLLALGLVVQPVLARGGERAPAETGILRRLLWWARWSSMLALLLGTALFTWEYHRVSGGLGVNANLEVDGRITGRALYVMTGIGLALVAWYMTWFMLWPACRRVLEGDDSRDAVRACRHARTAATAAGPMLLFMMAPQNYLADYSGLAVLVFVLVGALVMRGLFLVADRVTPGP